ncbi:hypothetical protein MOQ72_41505 [Saccharopolyspora sp. K220]|uniref:hypothetical protein n=1 Tax=Saccharopolyspora soli TaxID=2926618 RepID=UPI001F59FBBF|nr:hypothetical protein [Saccharopolyspora soli]MCI2423896.1 hypothetical protein [Saccharopolyspora soli]
MTSELRREYHVACGYLSALQACFDHLDRQGMDQVWTASARLSLEHIARLLADGMRFAEPDHGDGAEGAPPP